MTKLDTLNSVQNSVSSIFTKEDVINLISSIEEFKIEKNPTLSEDKIRTIARSIMVAIEEEANRDNIVCLDDVEFELNWDRRVEVTDVPINFDAIRDCIENELFDAFDQDDEIDEDENNEVIEAIANNEL
jgi:dihydroxyacetone kinase DhaKLM complex PTS-EIIA-like component DhaM